VRLIVSGQYCGQLNDTIVKPIRITIPRKDSIYPVVRTSLGIVTPLAALPGGVSYVWRPSLGLSSPNQRLTNALYGANDPNRILYTITIRDVNGCINNDQQEVWMFERPDVFAPTAFTPNGDGVNDVFIPFYINIKTLGSFRIFDRWGTKIFETNDLNKSWDGSLLGKRAPLDTYAWVVECYDAKGNKLMRKGMVTLVQY
jgi:gliding motility-associated-like protein